MEHNRQPIHRHGLGLSLTRLGLLLCEQGFYDEAKALYEESLELHRSLSDDHGVAITLLGMSDIAREQQEAAAIFIFCTESLRLFQGMQELWGVGYNLNNLALGAYIEGDLDRASALADECVTLNLRLSSQASHAESLSTAGWIALAQGSVHYAHEAFKQSLAGGWDHLAQVVARCHSRGSSSRSRG